jgi:hypothetical protein
MQHIYLFLMQQKCKTLISIVFGTVHSDRTGSLATQTNTLVPDLALPLILLALS